MTISEEFRFRSEVATSEQVLEANLARGDNFADTADMYSRRLWEQIIGD
jgi:aryl-alcohol dehydrogenase-like predicted oxidoreductase